MSNQAVNYINHFVNLGIFNVKYPCYSSDQPESKLSHNVYCNPVLNVWSGVNIEKRVYLCWMYYTMHAWEVLIICDDYNNMPLKGTGLDFNFNIMYTVLVTIKSSYNPCIMVLKQVIHIYTMHSCHAHTHTHTHFILKVQHVFFTTMERVMHVHKVIFTKYGQGKQWASSEYAVTNHGQDEVNTSFISGHYRWSIEYVHNNME